MYLKLIVPLIWKIRITEKQFFKGVKLLILVRYRSSYCSVSLTFPLSHSMLWVVTSSFPAPELFFFLLLSFIIITHYLLVDSSLCGIDIFVQTNNHLKMSKDCGKIACDRRPKYQLRYLIHAQLRCVLQGQGQGNRM